MADMVRSWKQGDEAQMNTLLFEDALDDTPHSVLFTTACSMKETDKMTVKIETMFAIKNTEKNYFVVVGSGHLIGDKGIVNPLKEKGYRVERF